jgi:hypothetical protein
MSETPKTTAFVEQARKVGKVRSGVLLVAWAVASMNEGSNPPETEGLRFELYEGMSFVLDTMAGELGEVYREMNVE